MREEKGGGDDGVTRTNIRSDSRKDNLALSGTFHRVCELSIIPGIDLAVAANERRLGVHVQYLPWQWPIRTGLGGSGEHDWEVEELC